MENLIGTSFANIKKEYKTIFVDFLNYLVLKKVDSEINYNRAESAFIALYKIYKSDFDEAILKSVEWISETLPGFKETRWDKEKYTFEAKEGFDIFFQYAPVEYRRIIKSSNQTVLDVYSEKFAKAYMTTASFNDKLNKALADLAMSLSDTQDKKGKPEFVIEPAVFKEGEMVNKEIATNVITNYESIILSATNLEQFSKALNAIAGAMGLNLNTDITVLAKIANKLREVKGLPPL